MKYWIPLFVVATLALGGCATLSKQECLQGDWGQIGFQDGNDGYPRSRLDDHREACAEYGVRPNPQAYYQGWEQGIYRYCTPQRGYDAGRNGSTYYNVCPPGVEAVFLKNYRLGRQIYDINQQINRVQGDLDNRRRDRDKAKDDKDRRNLDDRIRDLNWRLDDLYRQRRTLEMIGIILG